MIQEIKGYAEPLVQIMRYLVNLSEEIPPESREEQTRYFHRLFGSCNPLVVEIGSGNGHFLVDAALHHPEHNYIGTEILGGRARKFSQKIQKRKVNNIVVFKGDARQFLWEYLYKETVLEFIIMFPDPWPKKRHHKHRLLQQKLLKMLHHRLVPGGRVSICTDHSLYMNSIVEEFEKTGGFQSLHSESFTDYPDQFRGSLFELRFRKEKRELYFLQYVKT
jgi:tRNA (guanine-N7-)-methyltransferase